MNTKELGVVLKEKEFIDAKTANFMKKIIFDTFGHDAETLAKKYNISLPDMIRFRVAAERIKRTREKKDFTLRQVAHEMKVAKYKLEKIEEGRIKYIELDILNQYTEWLSLKTWFSKWKRHNPDVYKRIRKNSQQKA